MLPSMMIARFKDAPSLSACSVSSLFLQISYFEVPNSLFSLFLEVCSLSNGYYALLFNKSLFGFASYFNRSISLTFENKFIRIT